MFHRNSFLTIIVPRYIEEASQLSSCNGSSNSPIVSRHTDSHASLMEEYEELKFDLPGKRSHWSTWNHIAGSYPSYSPVTLLIITLLHTRSSKHG